MSKLLAGLLVALLGGFSAMARPLGQAAQSQEKSAEAPSDARLTHREKSRTPSPSGDIVIYVLRADGLPQGKSYSLTRTLMNGKTAEVPGKLHLDGSGRILTEDGGELDLVLGRTFPGEYMVFTLVSNDGTAEASVEITPIPIEAVGKEGCRLSVRPLSVRGDSFSVSGEGFSPGQQIKGVTRSYGEVSEVPLKNRGDGSLKLVVFPAVVGKSGGETSLTASDASCSVTVSYKWGDAMTGKAQTTAQAAPEAQPTPAVSPPATRQAAGTQPAATPTPELSKGAQRVRLAMQAVNLDSGIAFVKLIVDHVSEAIYFGKEKITHENAQNILERLQRERREVAKQIDKEGFEDIAGDYDWHGARLADCKLKEIPSDVGGSVTVVQKEHIVEFKGKGPAGCGIVVGDVAALSVGKCGGVSTTRLVARAWPNHTIRLTLLDPNFRISCYGGVLTTHSAQR